jgi:hypothetical protein
MRPKMSDAETMRTVRGTQYAERHPMFEGERGDCRSRWPALGGAPG